MAADEPNLPPAPESAQPWLAPATLDYTGAEYLPAGNQGGAPPAPALFELRPLTLSEVLDRTFALYRSRFWLFSGIAVFSGVIQGFVAAGQMMSQGRIMRQIGQPVGAPGAPPAFIPHFADLLGPIITLVGSLVFFLAYSVTTAATVWAVGEVYLGRAATVKESFRATVRRWYRYVVIALWQALSFAWIPSLTLVPAVILLANRNTGLKVAGGLLIAVGFFGGGVLGYILYLRNMFAVPACVTEHLPIRPSMRRSKALTPGSKGRIFVMQLVMFALYMVVGMLQMPFTFAAMFSLAKVHGAMPYVLQAVALVIGFLGHTVVTPILAVGITLLYFDSRVRKEAFDIAVLMGEEQLGGMDATATPSPDAYPAAQPTPVYPVNPASFTGVAEPIITAPSADESGEAQAGHAPLA